MQFKFDERRASQAAAVLLKLAGGRQNYTKLIKLLYLADRQALVETGSPITGSRLVNMANGPVLSHVYDRIKGQPARSLWGDFIRTAGYDVELLKEPGDSELSDFDVELLGELHRKYEKYTYSQMIDVVHRLKEWEDPGEGVLPLSPDDVVRAAGATDEALEEYRERNCYLQAVDRLLSSA